MEEELDSTGDFNDDVPPSLSRGDAILIDTPPITLESIDQEEVIRLNINATLAKFCAPWDGFRHLIQNW